MADLAEIAAAAGISIVDGNPGDGGDAGSTGGHAENRPLLRNPLPVESGDLCLHSEVLEYEGMFGNRYTESDPDYLKTVEDNESSNKPPCVTNFNVRRQRDDSRNWNRNRGGHGRYDGGQGHYGGGDRDGHRSRGNHQNNWGRQGRGGDWGRGDNRSNDRPRNYDNRNRDRSPYR
ncbi:unnamed protein product [Lymnaea stagnalis]|uniref:Uncharacterized protein n=1 Tax=Lymnaea stagnalis TaxID=6523 RepID=A0AAV2HTP1_LYMST